jgi:hypothetical protein
MVQSTENRMSDNLKVTGNTMPMLVWCDRKIGSRIRDAWPKAAVGWTSIVRIGGELLVNLPREAGRVLSGMPDGGGCLTELAVLGTLCLQVIARTECAR